MRNLFIELHQCRAGDEDARFGSGWEDLFTEQLVFYLSCDPAAADAVAASLLGTEPLRNPLDLLERQGVRIGPPEGVGEDAPDGIYFETDELGPCVAVNPERDRWTGFRFAFTAAHEYAHWLLRDIQVEEFDFDRPADDRAIRRQVRKDLGPERIAGTLDLIVWAVRDGRLEIDSALAFLEACYVGPALLRALDAREKSLHDLV